MLGPERCRQDHRRRDPRGLPHARRRRGDVLGFDPARRDRALRARVGIVLQECAVEPYLTVAEALAQRSNLYDDAPPGRRGHRPGRSGGEVRGPDQGPLRWPAAPARPGLALVGNPELIFLDEPTTGFDPSARREAWDVVRDLCAEGRTVVLTTHYMDEAQALADTVVVLAAGRIVASGPPGHPGRPRPRGVDRPLRPARGRGAAPTSRCPTGVVGRGRGPGSSSSPWPSPPRVLHELTRGRSTGARAWPGCRWCGPRSRTST